MIPLPFAIPTDLAGRSALGPDWADWLGRLPRIAADLLAEWELTIDGAAMNGHTSLVIPVRTGSSRSALKITFDGDDESEHEGLALQHWAGRGTVRLLRADPHRRALLLERLHCHDLNDLWDEDACGIIAAAYRRIHVPALPQLRTVTSYLRVWNAGLAALGKDAPIPRRLVEQAVSLAEDLIAEPGSVGTLIHGDLHYGNVLAGDREPWLVIDPKPMSGNPHYEVAPLLWNRWEELADDLRGGIRRRFHTVIDSAGFDEEAARDWVVVRAMHNAYWSVDDARLAQRSLDADDKEWITRMIAVAKAVQD